jgi:trehalose synthase
MMCSAAALGHDVRVAEPRDVEVTALSPHRLSRLIGAERVDELVGAADQARSALDGARIWNISSTSVGGGVAEMLRNIVAYSIGSGIEAHWLVIEGDQDFFRTTKRLHNRLHGTAGDGGDLDRVEAAHYGSVLEENAAALLNRVAKGDVVILHDPQTVGLAGTLAAHGALVVWRCHIGTERINDRTEEGWRFLSPYLAPCRAYVFSHRGFVPPLLESGDPYIIAPSIDPYSAKNRPLNDAQVERLMVNVGLFDDHGATAATGSVLGGGGPVPRGDRLVVQVSRWDRLKDMAGVLQGFASMVGGHAGLRLALVGPEVNSVSDDPEDANVLNECMTQWESLPPKLRRTIRIVGLPMDDVDANALMVNAIQRHATVVVQKSLEEGFGLTVAEAMWKGRPVIASAVGGIVDQLVPGTGVLLRAPADLDSFGRALADLLASSEQMSAMGRRARGRIRSHFLSDRHLIDYARLIEDLTRSA